MRKLRLLLVGLVLLVMPLFSAHSIWQNNPPPDDPGGSGSCTTNSCQTTCTGPTGVECCCFYSCPSGGTWVCKSGYCPSTSRSCFN
jgi:hypothetical protein